MSLFRIILCLLATYLLVLAFPVRAADETTPHWRVNKLKESSDNLAAIIQQPNGNPKLGKAAIAQLEGVYKHRFPNGDVAGNKYTSEDILEFVGISDVAAYLRLYLEFFNGHTCGLAGIVEYRDSGWFVFHDTSSSQDDRCALMMEAKDGKLI